MRRFIVLGTLLFSALAFAAVAAAHDKDPKEKGHRKGHGNKARTVIHTTDGGCAGNTWADDTIRRTVKVHKNSDGSYRIREEDKGIFVTNAGGVAASPGNCPENKSKHGTSVSLGKKGSVRGYITGTVTGGTFDPTASCSATPCTQSLFIAAFFGPTASFSCQTSSHDCKFKYDYHAKHREGLTYRHWTDKGTGAGSFLNEQFRGDIADH
jgi:hypothetical protein